MLGRLDEGIGLENGNYIAVYGVMHQLHCLVGIDFPFNPSQNSGFLKPNCIYLRNAFITHFIPTTTSKRRPNKNYRKTKDIHVSGKFEIEATVIDEAYLSF